MGDRDGSRPHGELVRLQATPRQRDERGAQRVRAWREQPRQRAVPAHAAGGLPLAQLRQSDHRHALGHRAGADRQAAGLLPHLVPARQRGADRRRALRRSARRRAGRPALRRPAAAVAAAAGALHRGADPGRRAHGDPAPQRRQPARRADVPRAGRRPPRLCGRRRAHQRARRHAERAAAPRARAERPGELGLGQRARPARSGLRVLRRGARQVRVPGQGARRADPGHRKPPQGQNYRGGSRSRAHRAAQRLREIAARRRRLRARPFRIFRHGRLAPVLPVSRPPAQAGPGRRAARRRALLEAGKPGPRRFRADRAARARRDPGGHRPGGSACRLSRRRYQVARARRGLRPVAGQHRSARPPAPARQRHQRGAAVEENARRPRRRQPRAALGRREEPVQPRGGLRFRRRHAEPRQQEAHPGAAQGRLRQAQRHGFRGRRGREHRSAQGEPGGRAAAGGRSAARAGLPACRIRRDEARRDHRRRSAAHRPGGARRRAARAPPAPVPQRPSALHADHRGAHREAARRQARRRRSLLPRAVRRDRRRLRRGGRIRPRRNGAPGRGALRHLAHAAAVRARAGALLRPASLRERLRHARQGERGAARRPQRQDARRPPRLSRGHPRQLPARRSFYRARPGARAREGRPLLQHLHHVQLEPVR